MTALRFGVIGVGRLGGAHARVLQEIPDVDLVGVHDTDTARAQEVAEKVGSRNFPDIDDLLGHVDAVVVAVTTSAHHAVTRAALEAGCNVLVEKPLTASLEEADDLVALAAAKQLFLGVGHVERFNPAIRACRPYLNNPRFLACQRLATFQPRGTDVPVMLDLMIHDIDLVLGLVDSEVESVHAIGVPLLTDSVDMANARIVFRNGAVADISASRASAERTRQLRLFQPSGYFSLDLAEGRGEYLRRRKDVDAAALFRMGGAPNSPSPASSSAYHWRRRPPNPCASNSRRFATYCSDCRATRQQPRTAGLPSRWLCGSDTKSSVRAMSLNDIREERKKLGSGTKRGPRTIVLILLLILVIMLIGYLDRVG